MLDAILPLVKKYGAAVVGLTLDKNGIPKTALDRLDIARRILNRALNYGIRREDVYIDCLTLTVSAEQEAACQTLEAVRRVKKELGLKTVLEMLDTPSTVFSPNSAFTRRRASSVWDAASCSADTVRVRQSMYTSSRRMP